MDARISLLGGFSVSVGGSVVADHQWSRRNASTLVKVLALAKGRRLHREQVIDLLWPDLPADLASPRLHQAAHYARRALRGAAGQGVVLRHDFVELLPDCDVTVDAVDFRAAAEAAIGAASGERAGAGADAAASAATALELYGGVLLPEDLYEPWARERRESLEQLHRELLRLTGRWEELLASDPADEEAHLAVARAHADRGDVRAAMRQLERLELTLRRELGTAPGVEAEALRAELTGTAASTPPVVEAARTDQRRLVGRRAVGDTLRERLATAQGGRGGALLVTGPPGVGKSSVLDLAEVLAGRAGWRTGRGTASAVEGPWPYAPCSRRSATSAAATPPCSTVSTTATARSWTARSPNARWPGRGKAPTSGSSSPRPSCCGSAPQVVVCCWSSTTSTRPTRRRCGCSHYLARCAASDQVLLVLAHRTTHNAALEEVHTSLVARGIGSRIDVAPLSESGTLRLLGERFPELDDATRQQIWAVSGGLPFTALELGAAAATGREPATISSVPPDTLRALQRAALLGLSFSTDEFLAVAGTSEAQAYEHLETAQAGLVVEWSETGYQFRHALVREAVLDSMPPAARGAARVAVARELAGSAHPPPASPTVHRGGPAAAGDPLRAAGGRDRRGARRLP